LQDLVIKATGLQPYSRHANLFSLFQDLASYCWRRDDGERSLGWRLEGERGWKGGVLLGKDGDAGAAGIERGCGEGMEEVPGVDWKMVSGVHVVREEDGPLWPYLLASELAPATAKRGEEKNVFSAASIALLVIFQSDAVFTIRPKRAA